MNTVLRYLTFVLVAVVAMTAALTAQSKSTDAQITLQISAVKKQYEAGGRIQIRFELHNLSNKTVLATRGAALHEFTFLEIIDSRGKQVPWRGKVISREYPADFFVRMKPGAKATFITTIVSEDGSGYAINSPGMYRVRAEYSLSPAEYFAPVAGGAIVPETPLKSNWITIIVH